jgi:hypothetical protein
MWLVVIISLNRKKLVAKHFEHPDATQPKVFISELLVEELTPHLQSNIQRF